MSNKNNVFPFETSATEGPPMPDNSTPTPEQLQEMQQKGGQEVIERIMKNRKLSHEQLQRAHESLTDVIDKIRDNRDQGPLMLKKDDRDSVWFSLEDVLRNIVRSTGAALTSMEANNALMEMIIHDLGGIQMNLDQTQRAMVVSNSHTQTLLQLLTEKGIISEPEMKATWDKLVEENKERIQQARSGQS